MMFFLDPSWWAWSGWSGVAALSQVVAAVGALVAVVFFWLQFDQVRRQVNDQRQHLRGHLLLVISQQPDGRLQEGKGTVEYVSGIEPANDVEVWIGNETGHYATRCPSLAPGRTTVDIDIRGVPDDMLDAWKVHWRELHEETLAAGACWWAAVTWRSPDGKADGWMLIQDQDGRQERRPLEIPQVRVRSGRSLWRRRRL